MKFPIALLAICATQAIAAPDIHVSPAGNDANDGSAGRPFATLEAARDAILAKGAGNGATVVFHEGSYFREQPLVLEPQDSGTKDHPVVYQATKGETPVLDGSRKISGWKPLPGSWNRGEFEVMAGATSSDIRLSAKIHLENKP